MVVLKIVLPQAFKNIWNAAYPYLKDSPRYYLYHTIISIDFVNRLNELEGGDESITLPAIILHDVGYTGITDEYLRKIGYWLNYGGKNPYVREIEDKHMEKGAEIALKILTDLHYDKGKIDEIVRIIRWHDYRFRPSYKEKMKANVNMAIVCDADALSKFTDFHVRYTAIESKITEEEFVRMLIDMKDKWFFTKHAKEIAEEELRKLFIYAKMTKYL